MTTIASPYLKRRQSLRRLDIHCSPSIVGLHGGHLENQRYARCVEKSNAKAIHSDRWFRERISDIFGLDLAQPGPPLVQTLDASF